MDIYTNREIVQYIREGFASIDRRLRRIEITMTDLQTAEADLVTAVTNIANFIQTSGLGALQQALDAANAQIATLQGQVSSDDAQVTSLTAQLAQSVADAQTAADNIETQVAALNALDTPATPAPVTGSSPEPTA
jgi:hypothetical protein